MPRGVKSEPGPMRYDVCRSPRGRAGAERHRKDGTPSCQPCRDAASKAHQLYKLRCMRQGEQLVSSIGTRRRLRALAAIGWTFGEIGTELGGWNHTTVQKLASERSDQCWLSTVQAVRGVYDRLSMTPGCSAYARNRAARQGWLPPLAWDDEMIEDPDYVPLEQVMRDWEQALTEDRAWEARHKKRLARQRKAAERDSEFLARQREREQTARESAA